LLVAGKRGVGKTTAVLEAVRILHINYEAMRQTKVLPIVINANNFETDYLTENKDEFLNILKLKRSILQNLIIELFNTFNTYENIFPKSHGIFAKQRRDHSSGDMFSGSGTALLRKLSDLNDRARAKEVKEETKLQDLLRDRYQLSKRSSKKFLSSIRISAVIGSLSLGLITAITQPFGEMGIWNMILPY
jgi:hypothetical protein